MIRRIKLAAVFFVIAFLGVGLPVLAFAQEAEPAPAEEVGLRIVASPPAAVPDDATVASMMIDVATHPSPTLWSVCGVLVMLIVIGLRKLTSVPKQWLPVVSAVVSAGPGIAVYLMSPKVSLEAAAAASGGIWAIANATWAGVVQPIAKASEKVPPQQEPQKTT